MHINKYLQISKPAKLDILNLTFKYNHFRYLKNLIGLLHDFVFFFLLIFIKKQSLKFLSSTSERKSKIALWLKNKLTSDDAL